MLNTSPFRGSVIVPYSCTVISQHIKISQLTYVMDIIVKYFRLTKTPTLPSTHTRPSALQNMKACGQAYCMVTKVSFSYFALTWLGKLEKSTYQR